MRFRLVVSLLLVPLAASAQVTLSSDQSTGTSPQIFVGKDTCKTKIINFSWDVGAGHPTLGEQVVTIKARASTTCGQTTAPSPPDTSTPAQSQGQLGSDQVKATELILDSSDGGLYNGCDNTDRKSSSPYTTYYCVQLQSTSAFGGPTNYASIPVNFALAPPTPPTGVVITPGDQHLKVDWSPGDSAENIAQYDVHVLQADAGLDTSRYSDRITGGGSSADVTKTDDGAPLQNDETYQVSIIATDAYANVSDPSTPAAGTPKHILDFYNLYRDEGGSALGGKGCSSTGAATWVAPLALAVGLFVRRRRKLRNAAMLVLGFALLAPAARADWKVAERPDRKLLFAMKLDKYDPKVDSEPGLTGQPYHEIFGSRVPLRWQMEADYEVLHKYGSLMAGVTIGYWQNFGKGLAADTKQPSQDTALLDVIPFGLVGTYRFDMLADMWPRFPLIPYAQLGLSRALWASFSGTGSVSTDTTHGGRGSGWTYGYTTALGVAFALDALEPDLAREAYVDTGIQRTSVFAEYGWTRLDDFGKKTGTMILTDRAWRFGLSVEF